MMRSYQDESVNEMARKAEMMGIDCYALSSQFPVGSIQEDAMLSAADDIEIIVKVFNSGEWNYETFMANMAWVIGNLRAAGIVPEKLLDGSGEMK